MDWWTWHANELEHSPIWQQRIDKLRSEAFAPRRSCMVLASYGSLDAIGAAASAAMAAPRGKHQWSGSRCDRYSLDPAPHYPLDALRRYLSRGQTAAHRFLGATAAAPEVHRLVCEGNGYRLDLSALRPLGGVAPASAAASMCAAYLSGASWGTPEAQRQAHRRESARQAWRYVR